MKRTVLLGVLGVVVIGAAWYATDEMRRRWAAAEGPVHPTARGTPPEAQAVLSAIREADAIIEPLQRCLRYPAPHGFDWPQDMIEADCRDTLTPLLDMDRATNWIDRGEADKLDAHLDGLLDGYYGGRVPEGAWFFAYRRFAYSDERTARLIESWIDQRQDSAHARLARAMHEEAVAWDARGNKYVRDTPESAMARMRGAVLKAIDDAELAIRLQPRLLPAYASLISSAKMIGRRELARRAMDDALAVVPHNYYVRSKYAETLEPRWGGSLEELEDFAQAAQAHVDRNPRLRRLLVLPEAERAMPVYQADRHTEAAPLFDTALRHGPTLSRMKIARYLHADTGNPLRAVEFASQRLRFLPEDHEERQLRATELVKLGEHDWALSELELLLKLSPGDSRVHRNYVWALHAARRYDDAEAFLLSLHAVDPDEPWTNRQLAMVYLYRQRRVEEAKPFIDRMFAADPDDGAAWLLQLDYIQNTNNRGLTEAALRFVEVADEDDEEQRLALPKVRAWLQSQGIEVDDAVPPDSSRAAPAAVEGAQ